MSEFQQLHTQNFHHVLERQQGLSLVLFSHDLCGSCRSWRRLLLDFARQHPSVHLFEVNAETEMALTNEFEIFHLPAIFLYHHGHYHAPLSCQASAQAVADSISQLLQQPALEMP